MNATTPAIQDLARRLIVLEAERVGPPATGGVAAVQACEKLQVPLARLVGTFGFRSLLSRALAMAKAEDPSLDAVQVRPDGSLEGWAGIWRAHDAEAGAVVLAHLLGLLVTFIGERITLQLVREGWPDAFVAEFAPESGEGS